MLSGKLSTVFVMMVCLLAVTLTAGDKTSLSGIWVINEDKCELDDMGMAFLPVEVELEQKAETIRVKKTIEREY